MPNVKLPDPPSEDPPAVKLPDPPPTPDRTTYVEETDDVSGVRTVCPFAESDADESGWTYYDERGPAGNIIAHHVVPTRLWGQYSKQHKF